MRILVVDDDPDQVIVRCMLLAHHGYETRRAGDPDSALRAAKEYRPEVVVVDIGLPAERDGLQLIGELRATHPDMSVVVLTGSSIERLRDNPELKDVADLLQKGSSCSGLLSSLARIAALRSAPTGTIHIQK